MACSTPDNSTCNREQNQMSTLLITNTAFSLIKPICLHGHHIYYWLTLFLYSIKSYKVPIYYSYQLSYEMLEARPWRKHTPSTRITQILCGLEPLTLSGFQFPLLWNRDNAAFFLRLLWGLYIKNHLKLYVIENKFGDYWRITGNKGNLLDEV